MYRRFAGPNFDGGRRWPRMIPLRLAAGLAAAGAVPTGWAGPVVVRPSHRVQFPAGPSVESAVFTSPSELVAAGAEDVVDLSSIAPLWLGLLSLLLALVVLVPALIAAYRRRGRRAGVPYCAACGYELSGLIAWPSEPNERSGESCSECGSRLSKRGAVAEGKRPAAADRLRSFACLTLASLSLILVLAPKSFNSVVPEAWLQSPRLHEWAEANSPGPVADFLLGESRTVRVVYRFETDSGSWHRLSAFGPEPLSQLRVSHDGGRVFSSEAAKLYEVSVSSGRRSVLLGASPRVRIGTEARVRSMDSAVLASFDDGSLLVVIADEAADERDDGGRLGDARSRAVVVRRGSVVREVASVPAYPIDRIGDVHRNWMWSPGGGEVGTVVALSSYREASATEEHRLFAFDVATGERIGEHVSWRLSRVPARHDLSPCGRWLYSARGDLGGAVVVRTCLLSGVRETVRALENVGIYIGVNASDVEDMIVAWELGGPVELLDARTGTVRAQLELPAGRFSVRDARVSPDGSRVALIREANLGVIKALLGGSPTPDEILVYELP